MKTLVVLIPCHNEEAGLGPVLSSIPYKQLKKNNIQVKIIVIDNASTDNTVAIAQKYKVLIVKEHRLGKGFAIRKGFASLPEHTDYVVMLDGDNTYKSSELLRMIEPLQSKFCDVVVGSRLGGKLKHQSLRFRNRLANWVYTFIVRYFYVANVTDVLSGYFAWTKESVDKLRPHINAEGFAIEMEMITKMVKLGMQVYSVPITYDQRLGTSKLNAFFDGYKILHMLFLNLNWKPKRHHIKKKDTDTSLQLAWRV